MAPGPQNFLETSTPSSLNKEPIFQVFFGALSFHLLVVWSTHKNIFKEEKGGHVGWRVGAKIGDPKDEVILSSRKLKGAKVPVIPYKNKFSLSLPLFHSLSHTLSPSLFFTLFLTLSLPPSLFISPSLSFFLSLSLSLSL
jgi:hypothetical protein